MSDQSRMDELEMRLAFQDESIRALNDVIAKQDRHILRLDEELKAVKTRLKALMQSAGDSALAPASEETPPPHY